MAQVFDENVVVLGLEGTAHTVGVGLVNGKGDVLGSVKHSFTSSEGGMVPRELAEHHFEWFPRLVKRALEEASLSWSDLGGVAYSAGPGIGTVLSVTGVVARSIALMHGLPIVPVNHCVAHIEVAKKFTGAVDPVVLYVSGGNSQVIGYDSNRYRVYGETLDIGVGNLLDSFGRDIGFGFPAGPKLDELYFKGKQYVGLPYTVKGMDVAFSGLLTAARKKIGLVSVEDLVFSLMHNAFAMLCETCERALAHTGKRELLLTGGVGASRALVEMLGVMCEERGVDFFVCPREFCSDNGVMIAWTGFLMFKSGRSVRVEDAFTSQRFRTDLEVVNWV